MSPRFSFFALATFVLSLGSPAFAGDLVQPSEVYVDALDDFSSVVDTDEIGVTDTGDTVTWNGASGPEANLIFGINAFATVQDGVNGVAPGGTVHIAAGTYTEGSRISIQKPLILQGDGANVTILSGEDTYPVMFVNASAQVNMSGLTLANGFNDSSANSAGGLELRSTLVMSNCTIRDNFSDWGAGGVSLWVDESNLTAVGSTFSGNQCDPSSSGGTAGGAIDCRFNSGLTLINSTFSGNIGVKGGGVWFRDIGSRFIQYCTFVGNNAAGHGGENNNVLGEGGAVANSGGGNVRLESSVLVGNVAQEPTNPDIIGQFEARGPNFIGDSAGFTNAGSGVTLTLDSTSTTPAEVVDLTLADNGGPTLTHALPRTSPAVNAADFGSPAFDQRGFSRRVMSVNDLGALETCASDVYVALTDDWIISSDTAPLNTLNSGDTVTWNNDEGNEVVDLIFGFNAFDDVSSAARNVCLGGTIWLNDGTYDQFGGLGLSRDVTMRGEGADVTFLSGQNESRVLNLSGDAITLEDFSVINGRINFGDQNGGPRRVANEATVGGGILSRSDLLIMNQVAITNNRASEGGGLCVLAGSAILTNCLIANNTATEGDGGGILNEVPITVINTTISGNGAQTFTSNGGGIYAQSGTVLRNVSIIDNSVGDLEGGSSGEGVAGGLGRPSGAQITASNTLIVGNDPSEIDGPVVDEDGNILKIPVDGSLGDIVGPLAENGGPTQTHAVVFGGPAHNQGSNGALVDLPATDQRHTGFARVNGLSVDVGAFEDQTQPMYSIVVADADKPEGNTGQTPFTFTVSRTGTGAATLNWTVARGSNLEETEVVNASGVVSFDAASNEETITVNINADLLVEARETFTVTISDLSDETAEISNATAIGQIQNDDSATYSIDDVSLAEGTGTTTNFNFTATLSAAVDDEVRVPYSVFLNAGTEAADLVSLPSGRVTFAAGVTSQTVTVQVVADAIVESNEGFTVTLQENEFPRDIRAGDFTGVGTIENDDTTTLTVNSPSIMEGDSGDTPVLGFIVTSSAAVEGGFNVLYNTAADSANITSDYTDVNGSLTFTGTASEQQTFDVTVIGDDVVELNESFFVDLRFTEQNPGVTIGGRGRGQITNDDQALITLNAPSVVEGDNGTTELGFLVNFSSAIDVPVSLNFATSNGDAEAGTDYTAVSGNFILAAGETEIQIPVSVTPELEIELDETIQAALSGLFNASRNVSFSGETSSVGTIENDDFGGVLVNDVMMDEGDDGQTTFTFTVSSTVLSASSYNIDYTIAGVTAGAADYSSTNGTLNFTGQTDGDMETRTIEVTVAGDTLVEADETFTITLAAGEGAPDDLDLAKPVGIGTITNDDSAEYSIDDLSLAEGTGAMTNFNFTATLSAVVDDEVSVPYSVALNTGTEAADLVSLPSGNVTFAAGVTSQTVTVQVVADAIVESDEGFTVTLQENEFSREISAGKSTGAGTIENDDLTTLTITSPSVTEGDSGDTPQLTFGVTSSAAVEGGFTVGYATANDSATGADYVEANSVLNFAGELGELEQFNVSIIGDDVVELNESFFANLTVQPANPSIVISQTDGQGIGLIRNDDSARVNVNRPSVLEGDEGVNELTFIVNLSSEVDTTVTVDFTTSDDDATAGEDYTAVSRTVELTEGDNEVRVPVSPDLDIELDERFFARVSDIMSSGRTVSLNTEGDALNSTGRILNDDFGGVSINDISMNEGDVGQTTFTFTVSSTAVLPEPFAINYSLNAGSTGASDVSGLNGTINFTGNTDDGTETREIAVEIPADLLVEGDEFFSITLEATEGTPQDLEILKDSGIATILNDDVAVVNVSSPSIEEGNDGTTTLNFELTLSQPVSAPVSVDFSPNGGSATAGEDYIAVTNQPVNFDAGQLSRTVSVTVLSERLVERDETIRVSVSNLNNSELDVILNGNAESLQATGRIVNDDSAIISLAIMDVLEGDDGLTPMEYRISLSNPSSKDILLILGIPPQTPSPVFAEEGSDFISEATRELVLRAGETELSVTVDVLGDELVELDEEVGGILVLPSGAGGFDISLEGGQGLIIRTGRILNDDFATVSVNSPSIVEGNDGLRELVFEVTLSDEVDVPVRVDFATNNGTAMAGDDYTAISGTRTLTQNVTEIRVQVTPEFVIEDDETLSLTLSNLNAEGRDVTFVNEEDELSGTGTIINDDLGTISLQDLEIVEGTGASNIARLVAEVSGDLQAFSDLLNDYIFSEEALFNVGVNEISATLITDFTAPDIILAIDNFSTDSGRLELLFTVRADALVERDEQLEFSIRDTSGILLQEGFRFIDDTALITILNDDDGVISVTNATVEEGNSGQSELVFDATLNTDVDTDVFVDFVAESGTAFGGEDFVEIGGPIQFIESEEGSIAQIRIPVMGDSKVELDETMQLRLLNLRAGGRDITFSNGETELTATGTIGNDDSAMVSISDAIVREGNSGTTLATFTVSHDAEIDPLVAGQGGNVAFTLNATLESVTADATDLIPLFPPATLRFSGDPNETQTVTIEVRGDDLVELNEQFIVNLVNLNAVQPEVSLLKGSGTGTIENDDSAMVTLDGGAVIEGDDGTPRVVFTARLSQPVDVPILADFRTVNDSAEVDDFRPANLSDQTISIDGTQFEVAVTPENLAEGDEFFTGLLENLRAEDRDVTFMVGDGSTSAQGVIENDDFAPQGEDDGVYTLLQAGDLVVPAEQGVLINDTDTDDETIFVSDVITDVTNGILTLAEDGSFTYTPNQGFNGDDEFIYEVSDGTNVGRATATIQVQQLIDIAVDIEVLQTPIVAGGQPLTTFLVMASNNGPSDATNAVLSQTSVFPAGVTLISAVPSTGSFVNGQWMLDLANGASANLTIVVQAGETVPAAADAIPFGLALTASDQEDSEASNDADAEVAAVISSGSIALESTPPVLDLQSGLLIGTVTVTNNHSQAVPGFRVTIGGLPADVRVHNATGINGGVPYLLRNQSLAAGASITLQVEFAQPNLENDFTPIYGVELLPFPEIIPAASGEGIVPNRMLTLTNGDFLIEIPSVEGQTYIIEYSDDMATWIRVQPSVTATGNRLQWIDNGPPKTVSRPPANGRFYRIVTPASR